MADQMMAGNEENAKRDSRSEVQRRLRAKNLALFAVLLGFAILVYFVAIVRMGGG